MGTILTIVDTATSIIISSRVYETICLPHTVSSTSEVDHSCFDRFLKDLVSLYACILDALFQVSDLLSKSAAKRAISAVCKPDATRMLVDSIREKEHVLIRQVEACKTRLSSETLAKMEQQLRKLAVPLSRIEGQVSACLKEVSRGEQIKILNWCSAIPYGAHHELVKDQRTVGTGNWLVSHPGFLEWQRDPLRPLLLLHGSRK